MLSSADWRGSLSDVRTPSNGATFVTTQDLRPLFTQRTRAFVKEGRMMTALAVTPRLTLDSDTVQLLRDGLGLYDMEIRWVAHLDSSGVLRLWRSWLGDQVYEAVVVDNGPGNEATVERLTVNQDPNHFGDRSSEEPELFERILISVVNTLRRFRAGIGPYDHPAPDREPPRWPRVDMPGRTPGIAP
jgi:hypothetical protein